MAKKKLTQKQLSLLRAEYLQKREDLLHKKVNALGLKLWDKVFESYLKVLEQENGKIVASEANINLINGLDSVYRNFILFDNIPVVKSFVQGVQGVVPLNEKYFKNIAQREISVTTEHAEAAVNRSLGVDNNGVIKQNGFTDKFLNDKKVLRKIKKDTMKALTQGKSFQDFRTELKTYIQGHPEIPNSGGLHQYYRNYAYDAYQKADRLAGDTFAKELSLRYFFYQGGLIKTSRPFCEHCNGKIIDSLKFRNLTKGDIKDDLQDGIPEDWNPMNDLGGYGCRHSKDWVVDSIAERYPTRVLNMGEITG